MDVKITIDYGSISHNFYSDLSLETFDEWKEKFRKTTGQIPEISKANWWYKKSDFGLFFLKSLKVNVNTPLDIKTDEDWRKFFPVFRNFFPTIGEYGAIKNNVLFWHGLSTKVVEDNYFVRWVLLRSCGSLNFVEISGMHFKDSMMMYYYELSVRIFLNADKYAKAGIIPGEGEEEEEVNMFR